MSYTLNYSDPAKNLNPIIVEDGTKNTRSTSLTLIGRNYPGYGQAIGEDLLHLLENFASPVPPNNPVEGQMWFDTSDPTNKRLRINDGSASAAKWSPINGIFQQATEPTTVKVGDIWVDTNVKQVKLWNGDSWVLVGPNVPGDPLTKTGSYTEIITDTLNVDHNVISNYVNGVRVEIISKEDFTPNPSISGFSTIEAGLNISQQNYGTDLQPNIPKINGIAESAYYLQLTVPTSQKVIADSFMRKDTDQRMLGTLSLAVDGNSLRIGSDPTFILERRNQYNARLVNLNEDGQFTFNISGSNTPVVTIQKTAGLTVDGPVNATDVNINGESVTQSFTPVGTITAYGGETAPSGWLICNGFNLGTNPVYQELRNVIGKRYDPAGNDYLLPNLTNSLTAGAVAINYIIKY